MKVIFITNELSQPKLNSNLQHRWTTSSSTFKALTDSLGSGFSVCNIILTQLEEIPREGHYPLYSTGLLKKPIFGICPRHPLKLFINALEE